MRTLALGQTERKASEVSARGFSEKGGAFRNQRRSDCTRLWGERGGGVTWHGRIEWSLAGGRRMSNLWSQRNRSQP